MESSYKIDEGYSEEPMRMESGIDDDDDGIGPNDLLDRVMNISEMEQSELVYRVLSKLKVSSIAEVWDRLWHVFHKDPIQYFPPEIMSEIFSYLTPSMLLEASRASRTWRERVLDSRLWNHKFEAEGWALDTEEIVRFEHTYNANRSGSRIAHGKQKDLGGKKARRPSSSIQTHGTQNPYRMQKRATFRSHLSKDSLEEEIPTEQDSSGDQEMPDASPVRDAQKSRDSLEKRRLSEFMQARELQGQDSSAGLTSPPPKVFPFMISSSGSELDASGQKPQPQQSLMLHTTAGDAKLNYHHVFKAKRKLEDNWTNGQYRSFQLPHKDFPEDAHTECVYTIQYSGRYLVSGSRDRTLRVWDLTRQRLLRVLQGHTGSVLCLQFDPSDEEDIIISGSSDTHVMLWSFSTGQIFKELKSAHKESVLNLKFDKRFLVTCSKDKTIKIWSRHEMRPGDKNYPVKGVSRGGQCPVHIIDMHTIAASLSNPQINSADMPWRLPPYTHLMTLDLHGAAVNAIQIHEDELVSASGDRNLRVWNIHTGECGTKIEAHAKGIACVQYDGKRIVSGSSDNTIRIWDPKSKTEVARLEGHSRLVRTIQAAFADVPGAQRSLEEEAEEVRRQWQAASIAGLIPPPTSMGRQHRGNPGSRKPRDIRSVGAKIPPSGGGSRWARIVSGSYDETIIIWRKTEDDEWVIGHRLRQDEALRAAGPQLISHSDAQAQGQAPIDVPNTASNPRAHQAAPPNPQTQPAATQGQSIGQAGPSTQQQQQQQHQQNVINQPQHSITAHPGPPFWQNPSLAQAYQQMVAGQTHSMNSTVSGMQQPPPSLPPLPPAPQAPVIRPPHPAAAAVGPPNARVFKLQFDARRIICCSQDPKIVGWDFANGDEQIIECCRFFAAPQ